MGFKVFLDRIRLFAAVREGLTPDYRRPEPSAGQQTTSPCHICGDKGFVVVSDGTPDGQSRLRKKIGMFARKTSFPESCGRLAMSSESRMSPIT